MRRCRRGVVGDELAGRACPGSTVRSSAAPIAANAIARGHVDRPCAARSNWITANLRTKLTSLWAAAVPSPQMHRPQQSSRVGSSVHRPALSIRLRQAPLRACASFKNRTALPARPFNIRISVGLSGGHHEHPGHVVGAVAVLGPGLGETSVLEGAATIRHPQQMGEYRGRRGRGHTSAGRSARSRSARRT